MTLCNMRADGVRSLDVCYIVTPIVGTPMTGRLIQWPPMAVRSPGCAGTLDSSRSCGRWAKIIIGRIPPWHGGVDLILVAVGAAP
jgi:hypothetical protein